MIKYITTYSNYFLHFLLIIIILFLLSNISNHPIIIIIILLIYRSLICLNICLWKSNYIISIFLFLIIIRGLLIIFLYFSRLISNEQLKIKVNFYLIILFLINITFSYYLIKFNPLNLFIYKYKFHENYPILHINKINFNNILNLYEYPINNLTILSIFYLLFSLFCIIKICSFKYISLRKIN